ncbi:uncharacterized protein LOC135689463 [Rhopilema esculentum]|uniref:uncharacterized protein LOC135689463 n=1 Tax=Rhopilema esculentum TaxID=499914 RepID=UPI0031E41509
MADKNSSRVLYYHPQMKVLATSIVQTCRNWKSTSGDERIRQGIELKDTIKWEKFPDGWPNLFIEDVKKDCAGRDVIFLGTLHSPELLFEQLSVVYSLPRYLAHSVTFIMPYFPTGTMERVELEGQVATASTFARLLSATPLSGRGPCQLVMYDIHALQERFYFSDSIIPRLESAIPLLLRELKTSDTSKITIAFPDEGAFKRFRNMFDENYPLITCIKIRENGKKIVKIKEGQAMNRHCIIVDDLVMTGGTLIECAKVLKSAGASKVSAYVTHAVFPKDSWRKFQTCEVAFENFYITDSIPHAIEISKNRPFTLLSLCDAISNALLGFDLLRN